MNEKEGTIKTKRNRKRGNADGSIWKVSTKQGAVRWRWAVTLGHDAAGKQIRPTGTSRTKGEAELALRDILTRKGNGEVAMPQDVTLDAFILKWKEEKRPYIAASTAEQREIYIRAYVPTELGAMKIQAIRLQHLKALDQSLIARELSGNTRRKVFSLLKSVLVMALSEGVIAVNPAASLEIRATLAEQQRGSKKKILEPDEIRRFFDHAAGHPFYPPIYTMFSLGLRRGEALGLRWTDVDFKKRTIRIEQQVRLVGNRAELSVPKTINAKRTISFSDDLARVLEVQREQQNGWRDRCESAWRETGLVFTTQIGTMVHPKHINNTCYTLCRQLGMPPFSSHTGRYTHISARLSRQEISVEMLAATVGHKDSKITQEVYRHLFDSERQAPAFDLSSFMTETSTDNLNEEETGEPS
ncbi:tyrosine-type recombinase/integrase [Deinococcus sp.]|uniref:tyrosine-type recombinase/integrase n=1 Tax=Deinococcus sp. TaxID=47478 RepID=UPI003C7BB2CC